MSHFFGWVYPPSAASDPSAPWHQIKPPCAVCGGNSNTCICPECPTCGEIGDDRCYAIPGHGLERTAAQIEARTYHEVLWEREVAHMNELLYRAYGDPHER